MKVEDNYQIIFDAIAPHIPKDWKTAIITSRILDNFDQCEYDYINELGEENWFDPGFDANGIVCDSFRAIREKLNANQDKFSHIKFFAHSTGKFNIELSYDN